MSNLDNSRHENTTMGTDPTIPVQSFWQKQSVRKWGYARLHERGLLGANQQGGRARLADDDTGKICTFMVLTEGLFADPFVASGRCWDVMLSRRRPRRPTDA
jgi:hypothetical protein